MYEFLTEQVGVPAGRIRVLLDKMATRKNILEGLQWLSANPVDEAYFAISGHGTRVPDLDGDEKETEFDQAILPYDYLKEGLILDDDLGFIYSTFAPQTRLIVHQDTCFSARSDRGRFFDLKEKIWNDRRPRSVDGLKIPRSAIRRKGDWLRPVLPRKHNLILISGCRDFETAADAYLDGKYQGAMTYAVLSAIRDQGASASYNQIVDAARTLLREKGFPQVPQIEGPESYLIKPAYT